MWADSEEEIRRRVDRELGHRLSDLVWRKLTQDGSKPAELIESILGRAGELRALYPDSFEEDREDDFEDLLDWCRLLDEVESELAGPDSELLGSLSRTDQKQGDRQRDISQLNTWHGHRNSLVRLSPEEEKRGYVVSNAILRRADTDEAIGAYINHFRARFGISDEHPLHEQRAREMWQLLHTKEGWQQYRDDPFAIAWREAAQAAARRFDWELEDAACWVVNRGTVGFREPVRVETVVIPWESRDNARVNLSIEPWVSSETVGAVYAKIRKMIMIERRQRRRAIPIGKLQLFDFVDRRVDQRGRPQLGKNWSDIHREWQEVVKKSSEDLPSYSRPTKLAQDYRKVRIELLGKTYQTLPPDARAPARPNVVRWYGVHDRELTRK